ncbi:MAG TPA: hypothetical protein VFR18_17645 [Terriglobia bacterium]|nr:hypothetical protein [Terriglobia bacterium]
MQGAITVDAERRFLCFRFDQRATVRDWVEARAIFLRLSDETGIRRALVDLRKQQVAGPVMELFEFGHNIPSGMVFAVLGDPHSHDHKFVETVALNRGKNVRLFFGSEEEAIEWLMTAAR